MKNLLKNCLIILFLGSIWACNNTTKSTSELSQNSDFQNVVTSEVDTNFVLENITRLSNFEQIEQKYGKENIKKDTTIAGPEGTEIQVSILFPATFQEVVLYWEDKNQFKKLHAVEIACDSTGYKGKWQSKLGIKPGQSLQQIVAINQKPFTISGFGWDYAGHVISWEGGKLDNQKLSGSFANFGENKLTERQYAEIQGDTEFNVSLEAIKILNPTLNKLMVFSKK
jgi:hypothetical protein